MKRALLLSVFVLIGYILNAQSLEIIRNGNLRSGPGTTNEIIGKVSIGMNVTQIDSSNDWYKIELPNKSSGWIYKTLIKSVNLGKTIVQQKPDTIQLASDAIALEIRRLIQKYIENEFFKVPLNISSTYPLKINLTHKLDGNNNISGSIGSIPLNGNFTIKSISGFTVYAYPKAEVGKNESSRPGLSVSSSVTIKDYNKSASNSNSNIMMFTTSGSSINSDNSVQCIKPGDFECSGNYFLNETIPMYFESGTIIFTDNDTPCNYEEGCSFIFDSVVYKYNNSKWVRY